MTRKKTLSIKERKAVDLLVDALRAGSLYSSDSFAASQLITRSLPDIARLPQPVIRNITTTALRHANTIASRNSENSKAQQPPELERASSSPVPYHANSNEMLPAARPKTPQTQSTHRKRRRISQAPTSRSPPDFLTPRPSERLEDIGGIPQVLISIRHLVEWPLSRRPLYDYLGVDPPRGLLLHGPPGCGKTMLAHAVAGSLDVPFFRLSGPEIVSGLSGESERTIRSVFEQATKLAPSIIFIDEIDAIAAKREAVSKDMERRIVSQLLTCIDHLSSRADPSEKHDSGYSDTEQESDPIIPKASSVVVLAATNRPESLEPALRRAGRFDREIELGAPDEAGRHSILAKLSRNLRFETSLNLSTIAKKTAGYVGADLSLLLKEAGLSCIRRFIENRPKQTDDQQLKNFCVTRYVGSTDHTSQDVPAASLTDDLKDNTPQGDAEMHGRLERKENNFMDTISDKGGLPSGIVSPTKPDDMGGLEISSIDFDVALHNIQPSALREGFATRPDLSWDNVGSLEAVREEMMMAIVQPVRRPEMFESLGLQTGGGVLLYGPPGCGKTLLARAVASESGANFISVKGPELLSKYVGDSELAVRRVFSRARSSAPCIIFFDELDALAPRRGSGGGGGESSGAAERVVNMLLTEMDGFVGRRNVFVVAATNRPDMIDAAMLRPGRLDKLVLVPLPDREGRVSILRTLARRVNIGGDVDLGRVGDDNRCEGFSGADLRALIQVAGEQALREHLKQPTEKDVHIAARHFNEALDVVKPSVSSRDAMSYTKMDKKLRNSRARVAGHDAGE